MKTTPIELIRVYNNIDLIIDIEPSDSKFKAEGIRFLHLAGVEAKAWNELDEKQRLLIANDEFEINIPMFTSTPYTEIPEDMARSISKFCSTYIDLGDFNIQKSQIAKLLDNKTPKSE